MPNVIPINGVKIIIYADDYEPSRPKNQLFNAASLYCLVTQPDWKIPLVCQIPHPG